MFSCWSLVRCGKRLVELGPLRGLPRFLRLLLDAGGAAERDATAGYALRRGLVGVEVEGGAIGVDRFVGATGRLLTESKCKEKLVDLAVKEKFIEFVPLEPALPVNYVAQIVFGRGGDWITRLAIGFKGADVRPQLLPDRFPDGADGVLLRRVVGAVAEEVRELRVVELVRNVECLLGRGNAAS